MDHSPDFNSDESFLSDWYLDPTKASWVRFMGSHVACLTVSMAFVALFLAKDDPAWVTVAYLILAAHLFGTIRAVARWVPAARGMVAKYEAKIAELAAALEEQEKAQAKPTLSP